uniref:Uncharacterized protein n=1 Tax=Romanomermis culicivorax TaxID=13658 RepID=A0A915JQ31_ROMCU
MLDSNVEAYKFVLTNHLVNLYEDIAKNIESAADKSNKYFDKKSKEHRLQGEMHCQSWRIRPMVCNKFWKIFVGFDGTENGRNR